MKDLYHNVLVTQASLPATRTTTLTSDSIDVQGFNSLSVLFALGQTGDTLSGSIKWTLKLTHSDVEASGYTDVPAADLISGAATVVVDANSLDEAVYSFGYGGGKRYVKAVATATGTHSNGTPMAVLAMRGSPAYSPVQ
jgi:hypothetical protein